MKYESSVTSVSWIPSEAIKGATKLPFELGIAHYDDPPPDVLPDVRKLIDADQIREANELKAWIDVRRGKIVDFGYIGRGHIGSTTLRLGSRRFTFEATALPTMQHMPEVTDDSVRFVQTAGGRTGVAAPRRVKGKPFLQLSAPLAWTTLGLTINADGSSSWEVVGASPFPRHWIYDANGDIVAKSGLIDFKGWYRRAFAQHSPWGHEESPALVTAAETALERKLSLLIMRGGSKPKIRKLGQGKVLTKQGEVGSDVYLLLDGVLSVEVDGNKVAEVGPGAVLGERAVLVGGRRTATLRAVTPSKVAVADGSQLDRESLSKLARGHRREETVRSRPARKKAT